MGAAPTAAPAPPNDLPLTARRSLLGWLERESLSVVVVAVCAAGLLVRLPAAMLSDSWMTLLYGRTIWHEGLPHVDTFTAWTHGVRWVDQQWLGQLLFGGLAELGGVRLALAAHGVLVVAALAAAVVLARRLGGSARSVPLVTVLAAPALFGDWVLRAQSIAYLLFVALFVLLVADARAPSRRVWWTLPLLVLWANVHGSVLLAAALVSLRGLTLLRGSRGRGVALMLLPWLCVFCSPYATELVPYYRSLLLNPVLGMVVTEWAPSTPSLLTAPFYALGFGAVALLARRWTAVTWFERLAVLFLLVSALFALRNMIWFSLAALLVLPPLLDDARGDPEAAAPARIARALPLFALAGALVSVAAVATRPSSWFESSYRPEAAAAVARSAARNPDLAVFADAQYADWLLWRHPELRGRVAYDARLELLTPRQLVNVYFWRSHIGKRWTTIPGCRAIVLVNRPEEPLTETSLLAEAHTRRIYRDSRVSVLERRLPRGCRS